jgi:hypothetical protein
MNRKLHYGLVGAGTALFVVVAFGAIRGAIFGNGDDYALHRTGMDGAFLGAVFFALFGGIPAILIGAGAGLVVGWRRNRSLVKLGVKGPADG